MPVYYDQLNRKVDLPHIPQRVVSIVPSQTELLFDLGLDEKIIGITTYCGHPADKIQHITKIGGTKKLDMAMIRQLRPELIIANKEENDRAQVEELMKLCPVWISDIDNLAGALDMIASIGEMLNCEKKAADLTHHILNRFNALPQLNLHLRAAYLIWRKPYMVAGTGTFIDSMLQTCGLTNAFAQNRYPEVSLQMLTDADPDVVLLSSEPYPFSQKHIKEFEMMLPKARIILVDGEMFSWYGSRLQYVPGYFEQLLVQILPA